MNPNPKQDLRFCGASPMRASFGTPGWALFTSLLLAFVPSGCSISSQFQQNLNVQAHLSAARTAPSGSMTTDSGGSVTALNLDDIGLSESALSVGIRIHLDHGPLRFLIDRIGTSSSSVGFFSGAFGGADLPGDNYGSEVDIVDYRILMAFPITAAARGEGGILDTRLLAGLDMTAIRINMISTSDPTVFAEFDELAPAPVLGLQSKLEIAPSWNLEGILTVLPLSEITGYDAKCIDGSIRLEWEADPQWNIFAGVRDHSIQLSRTADGRLIDLDLALELVEFGVIFRF
jgi:hypothetical protein